jgi:hypothetical protein
MDVQLSSLHQNTGISKDCGSDASSLQTLEFGGDCWIYYGLGPFRSNKSINSMMCNYGQYELYQIGIPRVLDLTYMVGVIPLKSRSYEKNKGGVWRGKQAGRQRADEASCGCVNYGSFNSLLREFQLMWVFQLTIAGVSTLS